MKQAVRTLHAGLPDVHVTVHHVIAEGDRAVARVTVDGTPTGYLLGLPPTGQRVRVTGVINARVDNDRVVELWSFGDVLGPLLGLGAVRLAPDFSPAAFPDPALG